MGIAFVSLVLLSTVVVIVSLPAATAASAAGGCPDDKPNCCSPLSSNFSLSDYQKYCMLRIGKFRSQSPDW